ncbi:D-alanine--D-alanine ligase family protein [Bifidobacterium panos]|uniref:D-alanine--D-alanine ligase n=1 Tax=Bifidobacterium panos TaxID=2675321 RepID=A0ABX1SXS3_9BIFI|nr:D-alanine--D-alanine ligase family protein [Bifidobacterium sp. DSM 109963]NMN02641.1 D-alanine--D-alanine ligase [Bifidobacterium sp. DSM 109963]
MTKKRIAVLYGGRADEHPISCVSAAGVLNAIDAERFDVLPIGITKTGQWIVDGPDPRNANLSGEAMPEVTVTATSRPVMLDVSLGKDGFFAADPHNPTNIAPLGHVDAVFPVLHGMYGEDGTVQGLLEMMGVPYVGCGVLASAACMDKHYTKVLLNAAGIPTAPGVMVDARRISAAEALEQVEQAGLQYPLFVKPSRSGSSFGVTKVEQPAALGEAIEKAGKHDWKVLIEQGIDAREIECAVLRPGEGDEPQVSQPGEIVLDRRETGDDQFYDFDSKYLDSSASHVEVPANLPAETLERVREVARRAFVAVDGAGLSRVDTFVTPSGTVMVNEINTMPGFTPISLYPKAWEAAGISYAALITRLIEGVLR